VNDFTRHAHAVKVSIWGSETSTDCRDFYDSKFTGEAIHHPRADESAGWTEYPVREGWSNAEYLAKRWAGCQKTSSRNAHTALRK
jgi:hypothetical protein